jgi:hypothetical protein
LQAGVAINGGRDTSRGQHAVQKRSQTIAALLAILAAYLVWFFATADPVGYSPLHIDEPGWISAGFAYTGLVAEGNLDATAWEQNVLGPFGNLNPHLGKLMLGAPLALYSNRYGGGQQYIVPYALNGEAPGGLLPEHQPSPELLRVARLAVKVVAAAAAAAIIAAVWWMCGATVAAVFAWILLTNGLFLLNSVRAMTDQHALLFLHLGLLCGIALLRANTRRAKAIAVTLLGVSAGLASSVKVTAIFLLGGYLLALLGILAWYGRVRARGAAQAIVLYGACGMLVIYALNPFLWPDVSRLNAGALCTEAWSLMAGNPPPSGAPLPAGTPWGDLTSPELQRDQIRAAYPQLSHVVLPPVEFFLMFPRWERFFEKIALMHPPKGVLEVPYGFSFKYARSPLEVPLLFLGLYLVWRQIRGTPRTAAPPLILSGLALMLIHYVFLAATLPVGGFGRYFLPLYAVSRIFTAIGIVGAGAWTYRRLKHLKRP